jgi:hypothetical protein
MRQEKNKAAYREDCTGDAQDFHREEFSRAIEQKALEFPLFQTSGKNQRLLFLTRAREFMNSERVAA